MISIVNYFKVYTIHHTPPDTVNYFTINITRHTPPDNVNCFTIDIIRHTPPDNVNYFTIDIIRHTPPDISINTSISARPNQFQSILHTIQLATQNNKIPSVI